MFSFHENLRAQRKLKGFTQETLAIKVNVVRQTVSKWEKGLSVPDADMLQRLAEVLEVTVSQLLGAEAPDTPGEQEDRNEIAEQLSRINEQLAIQNRRARRVWKGVIIALVVIFLLPIFMGIFAFVPLEDPEVAGKTEWLFHLKGQDYVYAVQYDENYQIRAAGGDAYIAELADTEQYDDANQLAAYLKEYMKQQGGTVSVQSQEGQELLE